MCYVLAVQRGEALSSSNTMAVNNAPILLFIVAALGVLYTSADPSAPFYADPWTFYATVSFPTSSSAYIAQARA